MFQTIQDRPRNDQVLRMDWNVAEKTTFYSRVQWGYEAYAGGVTALLGSGGGWPQQPSKYRSGAPDVNTLLHTFNSTTFSELTVGVNWSHQNTEALNQAAKDGNDRTLVLPGFQQFFPSANPSTSLPQRVFTGGGMPGTIAPFNVDNRWPFFGYNPLWNFSGNVTKIKGAHNIKTGSLRRTHDAAGAAASSSTAR